MPSITYSGTVINSDGYGRIATDVILGLLDRGWDVYLRDINNMSQSLPLAHPFIQKHYDALTRLAITDYHIAHYPPTQMVARMSSRVPTHLFTTFETTKLPIRWPSRINKNAASLITTSEWCASVFRSSGVEVPISVVHHGISYSDHDYSQWDRPRPLRFLMLAANPFDARKNGGLGLAAFLRAFPLDKFPDVQLWIKGYARHSFPVIDDPRIFVFQGHINTPAKEYLYQNCHYFLAPFRGEGFGIPIFESMAHGCLPIFTDWSTPAELIPELFGHRISLSGHSTVARDYPGLPYTENFLEDSDDLGMWAEPSFPHLLQIMRNVYELEDSVTSDHAYNVASWVHRNLSIDAMVDSMIDVITSYPELP